MAAQPAQLGRPGRGSRGWRHGGLADAGGVLALAVAGLISPVIPFAGAVLAYAMAEQDQGTFLLGAGLVHVLLVLTLLPGG